MGQGGFLDIINATPYDWTAGGHHSYQMASWENAFPAVIKSGQQVSVYIEFQENILQNWRDDGGEFAYAVGQSSSFQLQARYGNHPYLQVVFTGLATDSHAVGSTVGLGWIHGGHVPFILSGDNGTFSSISPSPSWMQYMLPIIGNIKLAGICLPGSHDAGMCVRNGGTAFGNLSNSQTQTLSIGDQLAAGSRYFDIRPVISGGIFKTGHYSYTGKPLGYQGMNGQLMTEIINQVNSFTENHSEVVILDFSHSMDTDDSSYPAFSSDQWKLLLADLQSIQRRFIVANPGSIPQLRINDLIANKPAAVIVLIEGNIDLGPFESAGFYPPSALNVINQYSDTEDLNTMINDQLAKMATYRNDYFLLSWTLTQSAVNAATNFVSVLDLAAQTKAPMYTRLWNSCSRTLIPKILYVDAFDGNVTAVAIALTMLASIPLGA